MKKLLFSSLLFILLVVACSSNTEVNSNMLSSKEVFRYTAVIEQEPGKFIDYMHDNYNAKYQFTIKDYSPTFERFPLFNNSYPLTNSYRALYLMDNALIFKVVDDSYKVEVEPEELKRGAKVELWVSSFGNQNDEYLEAKEINILP
jgi:hypothetical protein